MSLQFEPHLSNWASNASFHPLLSLLFLSYLEPELFGVYILLARAQHFSFSLARPKLKRRNRNVQQCKHVWGYDTQSSVKAHIARLGLSVTPEKV